MAFSRRFRSVLLLQGLLTERLGLRPGAWGAYAIAAAVVAVAMGLRSVLTPWLVGAQFITFFPAVIVATLLCGPAAGLFSLALSALAALYLAHVNGLSSKEGYAVAMFTGVALMDVGIISALLAANAALRGSLVHVDQLNAHLRESEARFRDLLESAPDAMVIVDQDDRITLVNAEAELLFGYGRAELLGEPIERLAPARYRERHLAHFKTYMTHPRTRLMCDAPDLRGLRKDGSEFPIEVKLSPLRAGDQISVSSLIRDVTARKLAEQRQSLLIHELNHRVKNTLATVQAISTQTLATTDGPQAFRIAFSARIAALSRSHDVLTRHDWTGASVREVVVEQLRPHDRPAGDRFSLTGPDVNLTPTAALALGMSLGELATNAAKHGALSVQAGAVNVEWTPRTEDGAPWLRLVWREAGGPAVREPERRGFGTRLIERGLIEGLGGVARLTFAPEGVVCQIDFPLAGGAA